MQREYVGSSQEGGSKAFFRLQKSASPESITESKIRPSVGMNVHGYGRATDKVAKLMKSIIDKHKASTGNSPTVTRPGLKMP